MGSVNREQLGGYILLIGIINLVNGDACVEHVNLTNWWRSSAYENDDFDHYDLCDQNLDAGWYRATTLAGGDMPRAAPGFNRCGTVYAIWLKGEYPTDGDTISSTVCVTGVFDDCSVENEIFIKNCGDYNVYYLHPTNACPEAYCFGDEQKCPPGYNSQNGFTPGCDGRDPPLLAQTVSLSYEVRQVDVPTDDTFYEIVFLCDYKEADLEDGVLFDVTFFIANKDVFSYKDLAAHDFPAELGESEFGKFQNKTTHEPNLGYGNNLTCRVQAKWSADDDAGRGVEASQYYGFEVDTPMPIRLDEGGEANIKVRSKLPLACSSVDPDCVIKVALHVPRYHEDFKKCAADDQESLLVLGKTNCTIAITENTWNISDFNIITVKAEASNVFGKEPRSLVAKFFADLQGQRPALSNLQLPPVLVTVTELAKFENLMCGARCDPHMTLYDQTAWDWMQPGEYIMYVNKRFDTEVQVRLEQCNKGKATCICAAMIRAGESLFILDTCKDRNQYGDVDGQREAPRSKLYDCNEGRSNMIIQKTGNEYLFILPTKTEVKVLFQRSEDYHDMYITPSVEDYVNAYGMCGHVDADGNTERLMRNGNAAKDWNQYAENWKPTDDERMWGGKSKVPDEPVYYCGCDTQADSEVVCGVTQDHEDCVDKIFTDKEFAVCRSGKARRRHMVLTGVKLRNTGVVDDDDDVVVDWEDEDIEIQEYEWLNGWTETSATQFCEDFILGRSSVKACKDVPDVDTDNPVEMCILDIKITGDTGFSANHVESIKHMCLTVASRNLSMWQQGSDGNGTVVPPADIIEASCPNECYDRGTCNAGNCTCNVGFSGVDCGVNDTAVPVLYKLPYGGVCDLKSWSCEASMVYGQHLSDTQDLSCRLEYFQVTASGMTKTSSDISPGYMSRPGAAVCSLGNFQHITDSMATGNEVLGLAYGIQVSNDGAHYGNTLLMVSYDSTCVICNNVGYTDISCVEKESICKISGQCYDDGDEKASGQSCMTCDVDSSASDWTLEMQNCFIDERCYGADDAHPSETCLTCDVDSTALDWTLTDSTSCYIEHRCYGEMEVDAEKECLVCNPNANAKQWTILGCLIDDMCVQDGALNPNNACDVCSPEDSQTLWAPLPGCGSGNSGSRAMPDTMATTILALASWVLFATG